MGLLGRLGQEIEGKSKIGGKASVLDIPLRDRREIHFRSSRLDPGLKIV